MAVEEVYDTGEYETVYNMRVADFHTYFVGGETWGFSVWAHNAPYPTDAAGRQKLADELTAKGLIPTQGKRSFDKAKINRMVEAMEKGPKSPTNPTGFDYEKASLQSVILGPNGEVLSGHHRVIAARLAGVNLAGIPGPRPQINRLPSALRQPDNWINVLPDVP